MPPPPISSKMQERWSKIGHAAREMVKVLSATFFLVTVAGHIFKTLWQPHINLLMMETII